MIEQGVCVLPRRIIEVDGVKMVNPYSIEEESKMTPEEVDKITEDTIRKYRESCKVSNS